jgi:hypothetical protein
MKNKMDITVSKTKGIKLGYGFTYDFKTNGDYYNTNDLILITPSFYHVDKEGKNRQPVDIYYEANGTLIKVGSDQDILKHILVLNHPYRNIPKKELENTAKAYEAQKRANYKNYNYYIERLTRLEKNQLKKGQNIRITEKQRTLIGDKETKNKPKNIEETKIIQSVQKWHGTYFLPNISHIVPKNMEIWKLPYLRTCEYPFIKGGYIIVNFELKTYKNYNTNKSVEQNKAISAYNNIGYNNLWKTEGFQLGQQGFELEYGDVLIYHADKRASQDFD